MCLRKSRFGSSIHSLTERPSFRDLAFSCECHATEVFGEKISDEVEYVNADSDGGILGSGINSVVEEVFNKLFCNSIATSRVEESDRFAIVYNGFHDQFGFASGDESREMGFIRY